MSLAALSHTAATQAFNGLFYTTVATVIPVLFLAIAVQGRTYEELLKAGSDAYQRGLLSRWRAASTGRQAPGPTLSPYAVIAIAILILAVAVAGEIVALISLYLQRPAGPPQAVLTAAVILTIAAAAAPALRLFRYTYGIESARRAEGAMPPPVIRSEPDKTDSA
jgi:hypothetical protein